MRRFCLVVLLWAIPLMARMDSERLFLVTIDAADKYQRTEIANLGFAIDAVFSDSVTVIAAESELEKLKQLRMKVEISALPRRLWDFPAGDSAFHNYKETVSALSALATENPSLVQKVSIGKSLQGSDLLGVRISSKPESDTLPTAVFFGCHHAREHLSVEVPLMLAQHLVKNYKTNSRIQQLLDTREVWIVPMVNPDGAEHDISTGSYKYWRKNRRNNGDGTYGVDLNRNYGAFWGGPGSSSSTSSETYRGKSEFSEPETQAVRDFLRARKKATALITFHTYSELVMWPYGHTYDDISNSADLQVFEKMGKQMATWNNYTPQKASDLYLASGDTTDWAYEELNLFAFTFELSPSSSSVGGFYPGAQAIEPTFKDNIEPSLYLIEMAENPFRSLEAQIDPLGRL